MKALLATSALFVTLAHAGQIEDYWFSGAEINRYDLKQARYGEQHEGHAEFIFVTEPFLVDKQVKDESGKGSSTQILKLNALRTFNTGIYSYRMMRSTFRPLDLEKYPHALKSTLGVQDWCGQVFHQMNYRDSTWQSELRSYFENEADQDVQLSGVTLEDELWITLRLSPDKLPTGQFKAIPSSLYSRLAHLPIKESDAIATVTKNAESTTYELEYPNLQRTLSIQFDSTFPHVIRSWTEKSPLGTTTGTLAKRLMNSEYWSLNQRKHGHHRRELGLSPEPK